MPPFLAPIHDANSRITSLLYCTEKLVSLLELDKLQNAVSVAGPDGDRGEINPQRCKNSRSRWIMTLQPTAAYSALCSLYL